MKAWTIFLKIAVTAALLAFMVSRLDRPSISLAFGNIDWRAYSLVLLILVVQMGVHVVAWNASLKSCGVTLPIGSVSRITLLSLFFSQMIPTFLGGMGARAYFAWKENAPVSQVLSSVVFERVMFLIALFSILLLALPFLDQRLGHRLDWPMAYLVFSVVLAGGMGLIWIGPSMLARFLRGGVTAKALFALTTIRDGFTRWVPSFTAFVALLVYHGLSLAAFYAMTRALGATAAPVDVAVLMPLVILAAAIPVSMNGWGMREAATVSVLAFAGVTAENAFLTSVGYGAGLLVTRLPMGLLLLAPKRDAS